MPPLRPNKRRSDRRYYVSDDCSSSSSDEYNGSSSHHYHRHPYRRSGRSTSYTRQSSDGRRGERRETPLPSRCIGVFGLNAITSQQKIHETFCKFGPISRIYMVMNPHNGRSRGFCFIYYESMNDARVAKSSSSGIEIDERRIRVDYSITQGEYTSTNTGVRSGPKYVRKSYRNEDSSNGRHYRRRRSSTPYYRNDYDRRLDSRFRTRSRTPRRSNRY